MDIAFDLALPLPPQLDAARVRLASRVAELRRAGCPVPRSIANQRAHWTQLLQVQDRYLSDAQLISEVEEAHKMVETAYREILRLAE